MQDNFGFYIDIKGPSNEELEKVLGLEEKMKEKEKEISALQSKLEKSKTQNDEELARMSEKDQQLEGKEQEIFKITELLTVTKVIVKMLCLLCLYGN